MVELNDILATYETAWSEANAEKRAEYLENCWAENAVYEDPTTRVEGRAALSDHIGGVLEQFPGSKIELTSGVDMHHNSLRFEWHLRLADRSIAIEGVDFATLSEDGRLASITGFFGPLPTAT